MASIKFPDDTNLISPKTADLIMAADSGDSNKLKEVSIQGIFDLLLGTSALATDLAVTLTSQKSVQLRLTADVNNTPEDDNPTIYFEQDGGLISAVMGLEGEAGTAFTGSLLDAFYIHHTGTSNQNIQFATNGALGLTVDENQNILIAAGSILTQNSGVLTLGGIGGTNNETLTFDFETTANIVKQSSDSGVVGIWTDLNLRIFDNNVIQFGTGARSQIKWDSTLTVDSLQLGLKTGRDLESGYFSIMRVEDQSTVNREPSAFSIDPVFRVYSSDNLNANDYVEFYHDQTTGKLASGDGGIFIEGLNHYGDYINKSGLTSQGLTFDGDDIATFTEGLIVTGLIESEQAQIDNININGNSIISTDTNGDINLTPNGTGEVVLNTYTKINETNIDLFVSGDSTNPVFQIYNVNSDDIRMGLGMYYDGSNLKSSDAGSNFQIRKISDGLNLNYDSGIAVGSNVTLNVGFRLRANGEVLIPGKVFIGTEITTNDSLLNFGGLGASNNPVIIFGEGLNNDFTIGHNGVGSGADNFFFIDSSLGASTNTFKIYGDGRVFMVDVINDTSVTSANVRIDLSTGQLLRTSCGEYWKNILGGHTPDLSKFKELQVLDFEEKSTGNKGTAFIGNENNYNLFPQSVGRIILNEGKEGEEIRYDDVNWNYLASLNVLKTQELETRIELLEAA